MKLANYFDQGIVKAGIVEEDMVYEIESMRSFGAVSSVDQILEDGLIGPLREASEAADGKSRKIPLSSVKLKSPVIYPEKILLVAVNYRSHGKEENMDVPASPYLFTKFWNALIGPGDPIVIPKVSRMVDWEVELAVVIGKKGKDIDRKDALEYVAGYTIANDISYRDYQFPPGWPEKKEPLGLNWVKGKGMDASFPLGPWLVTSDEIVDPHNLAISLSLNGEQRQSATTADLIVKVDALVSYASIGTTLQPGDIISTGTPPGVAHGSGSPYLKAGDVVEAKIERIGVLRNPVIGEK